VAMLGLVDDAQLEQELQSADIALVSQHYEGSEFNIPSKLMNFMAYGLPVLAVVNPAGEVARLVREAGAGWVLDSSDAAAFPSELQRLAAQRHEISHRGAAARRYAESHFTQAGFAERFERVLIEVSRRSQATGAGTGA
jgi:colanic acid biosynthesis glycosyl transferase WcaI